MAAPITFYDLFSVPHDEPSVTGYVALQTIEAPPPPNPVSDFIEIGSFRSGKPLEMALFKTIAELAGRHDPDGHGDRGVALAKAARSGFADDGVFGCADMRTVRVDDATPASTVLDDGAGTDLIRITTTDYGTQTNRSRRTVENGSVSGKKITLGDGVREFVGDNLGELIDIQYIGNAAVALLTVLNSIGKVTYTGQSTDADKLKVNAVTFEFDDDDDVAEGNVSVAIGDTAADTWENFRAAVLANVDGVSKAELDTADGVVTIAGPDVGVALVEVTDGGGVFAISHVPPSARLLVELGGKITYTGQPVDTDTFTVNGVVFEFDDDDVVTEGNIQITIGGDQDATYLALANAINANVPGVTARQTAASDIVTITSATLLVSITDNADNATVAAPQTDGSLGLDLSLATSTFRSIDALTNYIANQTGDFYDTTLSIYANKFLASTGLDPVSAVDILAAPQTLTGYVAAIVDWVSSQTRGNYIATELARAEPAEDGEELFTGGTTLPPSVARWEAGFELIGKTVERGGVVLVNSDSPVVLAMAQAFSKEQREKAGKWFRIYGGLRPAIGEDEAIKVVGALDYTRVHVTAQRLGVFGDNDQIEYLDPVFFAAALAGGASGNLPYVNPLTQKRLRFAGIHPDDEWDLAKRERLIHGGITVCKRENDAIVVALAVTTSRDPVKRMARIASEVAVADLIDSEMRAGYAQLRGRWVGPEIASRVYLIGSRILNRFVAEGAIIPGVDDEGKPMPAWRWVGKGFTYQAGVLKLDYQFFIGGELNHLSLRGAAEYQRIVGEAGRGGAVTQTTAVRI